MPVPVSRSTPHLNKNRSETRFFNSPDIVFFPFFSTAREGAEEAGAIRREYFGDHRPASTTLQGVRLATGPRCLVEVNAIAVVD